MRGVGLAPASQPAKEILMNRGNLCHALLWAECALATAALLCTAAFSR
jgi:hypothetical protein